MKAVIFRKYGSPDMLEWAEIGKPVPRDGDVLVKVRAASVNDWDWGVLRGKPLINRLLFGLLRPKISVLGVDIAGTVEAVGRGVTQFQPGDEVFGDLSAVGWGGFAEYACAPERALALKSPAMTFEQAAAVPQAALLSLQGLRDKRTIRPGDKVLINGAGGGAGTFAVQMVKAFGAEATGVDKAGKQDIMRKSGADHVIDYIREDFTRNGQQYDFILDIAAHRSVFDCKRALRPGGIYVVLGGSMTRILQVLLLGPWIAATSGRRMTILAHRPNKGLEMMRDLFEAGKVVPVIDRCYPLRETAEALRYFGSGEAKGKVIIII